MSLSIGSWVRMKPLTMGSHGIKKRYFQDINIHEKGLVKGFRINNGRKKLEIIQVAHVYLYIDMSKGQKKKFILSQIFQKLIVTYISCFFKRA
jgi:hypothetical protein